MIDRRSSLLACIGLLGAPWLARAQAPGKVYRIGILAAAGPANPAVSHLWQQFFQALRELGYVEGRNVVVEGRYYGDNVERAPAFAAELARLDVDVIVAGSSPAPEAARRATSTIPIVMGNHADPVASGLVASLAKPGGNVTGVSLVAPTLRIKLLQLLKEIRPGLSVVALLRNPTVPIELGDLEDAARTLGLKLRFVEASSPSELPAAFAAATKIPAGALIVIGAYMFWAQRVQLAKLAAASRLPTVYVLREHVDAGGLIAYGPDLAENFRLAAGYVDRIFRGARPADLPIHQPTKFELSINMKAARALGLTIPPAVFARADRIVE
jgi:putative ABC transport system substrate-binding protein